MDPVLLKLDDPLRRGSEVEKLNSLPAGDISPGVYAVSMRHDENSNRKLYKNFFGIPKEGYGNSGNPRKSFGLSPSLRRSSHWEKQGTLSKSN